MEEQKTNKPRGPKKTLTFNNNQQEELLEKLSDFWHPKYSSLTRSDFNSNVVDKWMEVRCSAPPKRRCQHLSFVHKGFVYIYGGMDINEGKMTDLHRVSVENFESPKWEEVKTNGVQPDRLSGQAGVLVKDHFYMFGGENECENSTNNLYILDLENFKWEKRIFLETDVPNLYGHTLNYYEKENKIIVFGGFSKGSYMKTVCCYSIESNEWTLYSEKSILKNNSTNNLTEFPEGRIFHSGIIYKDYLYIYAGLNEGSTLDDMWRFELILKTWEKIQFTNPEADLPNARSGHTTIYYEPWDAMIIFGGKYANIHERNELWKYDLKTQTFSIIHDTLLEKYADFENTQVAFMKRSYSIRKFGKIFKNYDFI
jgi:hypothetical protein